jgi:hypothetical protein
MNDEGAMPKIDSHNRMTSMLSLVTSESTTLLEPSYWCSTYLYTKDYINRSIVCMLELMRRWWLTPPDVRTGKAER